MFKTTLWASALLISTATAYASTQVTGRFDAWTTYAGTATDGRPICGASVQGNDRSFSIKYQDKSFFVHLKKRGWDIPEGTRITFTMQIDQAPIWRLNGKGHQSGGSSYIEFDFDSNETAPSGEKTIVEFTNLIMNGLNVAFEFPNGSEPDWTASLRGSTPAMHAFGVCMKVLDDAAHPTQPFTTRGAAETEAPAKTHTQPF
jgi:hypothetical protein